MKKIFVLLKDYCNGGDYECEILNLNEYVGIFPTWEKAYDKICQIRQEETEEATKNGTLPPTPIKKEYGQFEWRQEGQNGWTETWTFEIREDEYEEE